jgi:hypothetical protein
LFYIYLFVLQLQEVPRGKEGLEAHKKRRRKTTQAVKATPHII